MNESPDDREPDLFDRVANALSDKDRAEYYREMRHLRSLPENDEMLRILRAMQFSVILINDAPGRMAIEVERLKGIFDDGFGSLREILQALKTQQAQLNQRLARLPQAVAEGIKPGAIVATINESLRQQFVQTTIPETARSLALVGADMRKSLAEFVQTADKLSDSYTGVVEKANTAVSRLESTSLESIQKSDRAAANAYYVSDRKNRWTLYVFLAIALLAGVALMVAYQSFLNWVAPDVGPTPVMQSAPPIKTPATKAPARKPRVKR